MKYRPGLVVTDAAGDGPAPAAGQSAGGGMTRPAPAPADPPAGDDDAGRWREAARLRREHSRWIVIWLAPIRRFRAYARLPGTRRDTALTAATLQLEKEAISGAIALTASRLVVWTGRSKHIDVPLNHPLRAAIEVSYDPPDRVRFAYDAAAFGPSRSGQVEVRLRTPQAAHIADLLAAAPG